MQIFIVLDRSSMQVHIYRYPISFPGRLDGHGSYVYGLPRRIFWGSSATLTRRCSSIGTQSGKSKGKLKQRNSPQNQRPTARKVQDWGPLKIGLYIITGCYWQIANLNSPEIASLAPVVSFETQNSPRWKRRVKTWCQSPGTEQCWWYTGRPLVVLVLRCTNSFWRKSAVMLFEVLLGTRTARVIGSSSGSDSLISWQCQSSRHSYSHVLPME